jgi:hypothetical protein
MGLNAKDGIGGKSKLSFKLMEAGSAPARLVQIIDLGLQPDMYQGVEQAPKRRLLYTYEFPYEFMLDEEGKEMADKPRWLSEDMPFYSLGASKAKSTERYNAFDPSGMHDGDLEKCLGAPVMVTIIHNPGKGKNKDRVFENIAGVSAMQSKMAATLPKLVNEPKLFNLDEPDLELFNSLPDFIKSKIVGNLEFTGSKLDGLLNKGKAPTPPKQTLKEELDDEAPY